MTDELPQLPIYSTQAMSADKGVRMVADAIADQLGWIFREQNHADLGIDAQVEIVKEGKGTGRLIAMQIKSGPSWFKQKTDTGWVYHGEAKHLAYWIGHSLPVIICLCRPQSNEVFWVQITEASTSRTSSGWIANVPFRQMLDRSSKEALTRIGYGPQHSDIVELLIPRYLQERYSRRIYIHPIEQTPHDFHGLAYMTTLDEQDVMFVDFIYTPMERLTAESIDRRVSWRSYNERAAGMGPTRLQVLVVVDNADAVLIESGLARHLNEIRDFELAFVVYSRVPFFGLQEVTEDGRGVSYDPWGMRHVSEQR